MLWRGRQHSSFQHTGVPAQPPEQKRSQMRVAVALFILATAAWLALALISLREEALSNGQQLTESLAHVIAEQTGRTFQAVDERLKLAASNLQTMEAAGTLNELSAHALLREQLQGLPFVRAIWVMNRDGRIVMDSDTGNIGTSLADREYFRVYKRRPNTGFFVGPVVLSRTTGTWLMSATRPLHSVSGEFTGVIVAAVEPPYFEQLWQGVGPGPGGAVSLYNHDGHLMVRSPRSDGAVGRDFSSLPLFSSLLPAEPQGVYTSVSMIDGRERVSAYRVVTSYPELVVSVGLPVQDMLASWRRFAVLTSTVWIAAVLTALALVFQLQRQTRRRERSSMRFGQLAQAMPQIVFITDEKGHVQFVNNRWAEYTGRPTEEAMGRGWMSQVHPDDRELAVESMLALLRTGQGLEDEHRLLYADGIYRWQLLRAVPVRDGDTLLWFGTSTEIDELKHAQAQLTAQAQEVRELNAGLEEKVGERTRELEAFSYSVSHDLQSPLQRAVSFAKLLEKEMGDAASDKARHYLARIRANTDYMARLIDGLLMLAEVSQLDMVRGKVNLSAMATDILERLKAEEPQRQVTWQVEPGLVATAADARLMRSAMENLLENAWKFTAHKEGAHIKVDGSRETGVFFVSDNGAGFDMAYADKLFSAFQRLHNTEEFPGAGTGLATVARAIARHGGRVWAESVAGQGATFYFTVPTQE